jgi:hypothetical protein
VPSEEHPTDCSITRIAGHPDFAIVIYLRGVITVSVQGSTFAFTVSLLVDSVFIITKMFADIAPGKSFAIRESAGYLKQDSGGSGLSTP